jgi:hypothetical protein
MFLLTKPFCLEVGAQVNVSISQDAALNLRLTRGNMRTYFSLRVTRPTPRPVLCALPPLPPSLPPSQFGPVLCSKARSE